MRLASLIGVLATLAVVNCQRRVTAASSFSGDQSGDGSDDDTLNVFGVTRSPLDSGSDNSNFGPGSAGSSSGSGNGGHHRKHHHHGHGGGNNGNNDNNGNNGNNGNSDDSGDDSGFDTGFNRLTTQDPRFDGSNGGGGSGSDRDSSAFVNRGPGRRTTRSSFGGSGDGDFGSDSGFNSGSSGRFSQQFPDNYRIEVEVQRLEDKGSITATGSSCDVLSKCDPKLYAFIETDKPLSSWPGSVPLAKWPVIFAATNSDSPTINKIVTRDVCNGVSVSQADLRVRAVDSDSISREDEINKFDCLFSLSPSSIGSDPNSAQWGDSMECKPTSQVGKIKLFARQRAYRISSSNCNSQMSF